MAGKIDKVRKVLLIAKTLGHNPDLDKAKQIADRFTLEELTRIYWSVTNTGRRVKYGRAYTRAT